MYEALKAIVGYIHSVFSTLAVDVGGGVRLDLIIILLIIFSMFAGIWFKGAKG